MASARSVDDALVLKAVVEHTLLPTVRGASSGNNLQTVVLIVDRSIPLCKNTQGSATRCRIPDHWQQFLVPNPARGWPGLIGDARRRGELVESLEARNNLPQALPAIEHPAVVLIPADRREEAQRQYREQTVVIICSWLFLGWVRPYVRVIYVWQRVWLRLAIRRGETRRPVASAVRDRDRG